MGTLIIIFLLICILLAVAPGLRKALGIAAFILLVLWAWGHEKRLQEEHEAARQQHDEQQQAI
jgi:hypothetical protein